jgi:hypothetical protein
VIEDEEKKEITQKDALVKLKKLGLVSIRMETEKVITGFILMTKKKYMGLMYMKRGKDEKPVYKNVGDVKKKRDFPDIIGIMHTKMCRLLIESINIADNFEIFKKAFDFFEEMCRDILHGKYPKNLFSMSKNVKMDGQYHNPGGQAHYMAFLRHLKRSGGGSGEDAPGGRVVYVVTRPDGPILDQKTNRMRDAKVSDVTELLDYVENPESKKEIWYDYYISHYTTKTIGVLLGFLINPLLAKFPTYNQYVSFCKLVKMPPDLTPQKFDTLDDNRKMNLSTITEISMKKIVESIIAKHSLYDTVKSIAGIRNSYNKRPLKRHQDLPASWISKAKDHALEMYTKYSHWKLELDEEKTECKKKERYDGIARIYNDNVEAIRRTSIGILDALIEDFGVYDFVLTDEILDTLYEKRMSINFARLKLARLKLDKLSFVKRFNKNERRNKE